MESLAAEWRVGGMVEMTVEMWVDLKVVWLAATKAGATAEMMVARKDLVLADWLVTHEAVEKVA
jgi:hypothetical protein